MHHYSQGGGYPITTTGTNKPQVNFTTHTGTPGISSHHSTFEVGKLPSQQTNSGMRTTVPAQGYNNPPKQGGQDALGMALFGMTGSNDRAGGNTGARVPQPVSLQDNQGSDNILATLLDKNVL